MAELNSARSRKNFSYARTLHWGQQTSRSSKTNPGVQQIMKAPRKRKSGQNTTKPINILMHQHYEKTL